MNEERKPEQFQDDLNKWKIYFDIERQGQVGDATVLVSFMLNRKEYPLIEKELSELKQDLRDLGKLRIIKQGKNLLEK